MPRAACRDSAHISSISPGLNRFRTGRSPGLVRSLLCRSQSSLRTRSSLSVRTYTRSPSTVGVLRGPPPLSFPWAGPTTFAQTTLPSVRLSADDAAVTADRALQVDAVRAMRFLHLSNNASPAAAGILRSRLWGPTVGVLPGFDAPGPGLSGRRVKRNIAAFGGNPNNVTISGFPQVAFRCTACWRRRRRAGCFTKPAANPDAQLLLAFESLQPGRETPWTMAVLAGEIGRGGARGICLPLLRRRLVRRALQHHEHLLEVSR